jgi:small subunit ribosomal protein S20
MRAVTKETENLSKEGKKDEAKAKLSEAYKAIDKAVKRGVIKKNTASRRKSRLAKRIK